MASYQQAVLRGFADRFLVTFGSLPKCLLGIERPGASTVLIDNDYGMAELVRHLVLTHRLTNLALISGPEGSEDGERRYAVFRETLLQNGITLAPSLTIDGDFLARRPG